MSRFLMLIVLGLVFGFSGLSQKVMAQDPVPVTVCIKQNNGNARFIQADKNCNNSELGPFDIDLAEPGPEGPEGPQGPIGATGPAGPQGPAGPTGPVGADGAPGPAGASGPQGDTGEQGPAGADGEDGSGFGTFVKDTLEDCDGNGNPGTEFQVFQDINNNGTYEDGTDIELDTFSLCNGPEGIAGLNGEDGAPGVDGQDGAPGAAGAPGAQGPAGADGSQGPAGPTGPVGADGSQGPAGQDGIGLDPGTANRNILVWDNTGMDWTEASGDTRQPYLAVNYIIALQGLYPSRSAADPILGEIIMFAGNFAPRGWAFCDGQLLSVAQNSALFSLLGTTYGGDGRTTFGLPDLRGRVSLHPGRGPGLSDYRQGQMGGSETH